MTEPYTIIRRFLFLFLTISLVGIVSLDRNYQEVINLSFVLPGLYLKTERMLQFGNSSARGQKTKIGFLAI